MIHTQSHIRNTDQNVLFQIKVKMSMLTVVCLYLVVWLEFSPQ